MGRSRHKVLPFPISLITWWIRKTEVKNETSVRKMAPNFASLDQANDK